jgi:hypothetical protein
MSTQPIDGETAMHHFIALTESALQQRLVKLGEQLAAYGAHIQRQTWRSDYWQPRCYDGDPHWQPPRDHR